MDKHYTIAEMGKILNIPESTVRYYRDRYQQYIPFKGQGRKKRYAEQALNVLRIIAEESNRNITAEEIDKLLSLKFTSFVEVEDETAIKTAVTQQQLNLVPFDMLSSITESLKVIADKTILFEQQQQIIAEQNRRIANLEIEMQALKESQQTAKQQQQSNITLLGGTQTKEKTGFWSMFRK